MTEQSRQAIAELLTLAPYLDQHLTLDEEEVLEHALKAIGWDPQNPGKILLPNLIALAREVSADDEKTEAFMRERAATLKFSGDAELAYHWLTRVLESDGTSAKETRFLSQIKPMLFG
ncbi:hypothetical protein ACFQY0_15015 [Haloferula chungangensis]|uniref:TerB family tellurite resistance protein n=1 Tax=Haloferula chungangensis TaxID=1048331 RepID=A0ABW2L7X4_9BACT